jgi:hypothetical protein
MDEGIPGLVGFTDLATSIDSAREVDRPLFIYFTAYAAVNARKLSELGVLSSPEIRAMIKSDFVVLYQYVDDRRPDPDATPNSSTGERATRGSTCVAFQRATFKNVTLPYCGFMDPVSLEAVGGFEGYGTDAERIKITLENAAHYFENNDR